MSEASLAKLFATSKTTEFMDRAACTKADPNMFFPNPGDYHIADAAIKICKRCPVLDECLEYSIATRQVYGIWGAMSERQRRKLMDAPPKLYGAAAKSYRRSMASQ